jgi:tetratricopeptide (TPR) repeat protein
MNPVASSEHVLNSGVDAQNPWPGLVAFTEELQQFFHGRAEEADELQRRVERKSLTVLFGQSGLGKSSLLYAALFPRLRAEGYLPVPIRLDHTSSAPALSAQVKAAVTRAIQESGGRAESGAADAGDTLWEHFHRRSLCQLMQDGKPVRLVLVFDQFEELFAIGQASEATRGRAAHFLKELADFIENRAPETLERRLEENPELAKDFIFGKLDYRTLVALREDYLPHLESLRLSMPSITENRMRLTRMSGTAALEAVIKPGRNLITPEVGRQVVRFVAGSQLRHTAAAGAQADADDLSDLQVEPSLLSLVCRELNGRRLALGLPQITADLVAGNRERILQDFYERCVADQPPAVRAFVEDELVTDSGLRENMALERARRILSQRGAPASAIDELVKRRLLHLEERLDIQRVELTHDVLTTVVKKSRDERQQKEATLRAELQAQETREKARRQRKRARLIMAGMAVAMVAVLTFGAVSFYQYHVSYERWLEAERQKHEAENQKERAEKGEQDAKQARAEAVTEKDIAEANRKLAEHMLAQFSDKQLREMPGTQEIRRVLFKRGVETYESMFREKLNDPIVQLSLVDRYAELGRLQSEIGTLDQALEPLKKGEKVLRRLVEQEPTNPEYRFRLGVIVYEIGYCCWEHKKSEIGVPALRDAVQILSELGKSEPKNFDNALYLALARTRLGALTPDWKKERQELYQMAHDSLKQLVAERPKDARALTALARVTSNRGWVAADNRDYKEGEAFLEEARQAAQRSIEADPTDQITYQYLKLAVMGLGQIYRETNRVAKGIELVAPVVEDLGKVANANPAVLFYQQSLVWAHDDLRKLYQRAGDYAKAVASLQEIIRITDAMAKRDPQNHQLPYESVEASLGIYDIYLARKRRADAAVILDKVIQQAETMMSVHPTSDLVLRRLLKTHEQRGLLSLDVQEYEKARETYQKGVDLFTRYRPSIQELGEHSHYNYLQCCHGLLQIAKEKKEAERAISLAKKLILPITIETFTTGDYKQSLITEWVTLSELYEDTGSVDEAIRLRLRAAEESNKILAGDPKSNFYVYQYVYRSHRHLARMYRKSKDQPHEFEAIRSFLKEEHSYEREKDHSELLAQTADFTPQNLSRLREAFDRFSLEGGLTRFTVQVDWTGVKFPFHIYVVDSWQYFEDQVTWVEKVRGGKFPQEVVDSFHRIYKIAKDNKVSFRELCVYALGTATGAGNANNDNPIVQSKTDAKIANTDKYLIISRELAAAMQEIQSGKAPLFSRRRLLVKYARLAEDEIAASEYFRAGSFLSEARGHIDLDSFGRLRNPKHSEVYAYIQYVEGAHLASLGELEKGYSKVMDSFRTEPDTVTAEFAIPAGNREFALGWICLKLKRPAESATWYRKAIELGHLFAADRLFLVYQEHPHSARALPAELRELLQTAKTAAAFTRLVAEGQGTLRPTPAPEKRNEQIVQLQDLAAQYHNLADGYKAQGRRAEYRKALNKEFDIRGRQVKLNPTDVNLKDAQILVAVELTKSHQESKETQAALDWTTRAADLGHVDSLLVLADWYEKGTHVTADAKKAAQYRFAGYLRRGTQAFQAGRYEDALPDLKKVCELPEGLPGDYNQLGMCYGKLKRWDEAISAYQRSFELESNTSADTSTLLNLLEAYVVSERPKDAEIFSAGLAQKKWQPRATTSNRLNQDFAMFYGFQAVAQRMLGKDATEMEKNMRQYTVLTNMKAMAWGWQEIDDWLKTTKLAADRKASVEKILVELKTDGQVTKLTTAAGGKIVLKITGKLTATDPLDKVLTKSHHQVHTLKMTAGISYTIDLESTDFDNYLRLEDSTGKQLAEDDDSGSNLNARIIHVAAKDDTVRIIATSYKAGAIGSYVLTVRETPAKGAVTSFDKQLAQLQDLAKQHRDSADAYKAKGKREEYRMALNKEFEVRGQQVTLNPTNALLKNAQGKVAAEIASSYLESKEPGEAKVWIANAGQMAPIESLLQLAEYLEKGINIKADPKTANHYRYQAYSRRGLKAFLDRRYKEALPDLKRASELPDATPDDYLELGMCYGKSGQWKGAINAYQRALELEPDTVRGTGTVLSLLEAYITSDSPADADQFADGLVKKKWQPKATDALRLNQDFALFYGFHAVARRALGKDATDLEKKMREYTVLAKMDQSKWGWDEINEWWKTTKLAPDRKAAVEVILAELKGLTPLDQKTAFAGYAGILSGTGTRKVHSLPLNTGKTYQIDVTGDFDTVLRIEDSQKKELVHNDDVNLLASNLNSRLIFSPTKDDAYRLIVSPLKAGVTGKYQLKMQEVVKIGKEELTKGELTVKDEKYKTSFAHKHKIQLEAGRPYTIELDSDKYDTRLVLFDPAGIRIAAQNEGISPTNFRLSRIDFTPHMTATYVILATSYDPGKTGPYTLRVQGYGPAAGMK